MTDQQQADLRHDEMEAGTQTVLGTPSVDVTEGRQNSLWSDAWRSLRRNPLFWIGSFLTFVFSVMALVPQLFARGADPARVQPVELAGARRRASTGSASTSRDATTWPTWSTGRATR